LDIDVLGTRERQYWSALTTQHVLWKKVRVTQSYVEIHQLPQVKVVTKSYVSCVPSAERHEIITVGCYQASERNFFILILGFNCAVF